MRCLLRDSVLVAILLFGVADSAAAQIYSSGHHPPSRAREGISVSFGFGPGYELLDVESPKKLRGAYYLRMGWSPKNSWLLGVDVTAFGRSQQDTNFTQTSVGGAVQWYPGHATDVFFKTGVGWARWPERYEDGGASIPSQRNGLAFDVGLGYDYRVAKEMFLTFTGEFFWSWRSSDANSRMGLVTVGFSRR